MAITVTATSAGSTANGILLRVFVLTGAKVAASQTGNSNSTQFSATGTFTASITNSANSSIYGSSQYGSSSGTVTASNSTLVDNQSDAGSGQTYVTFHAVNLTSGTTTRGYTVSLSETGPFAMLEILASGTLAEDGSAPAVAFTGSASTVTTASFTPVGGSLLVALVNAKGGVSTETMTVSGGSLTWTEKVKNNPSGGHYAGIWIADNPVPPNGTVQPRATVQVPRRRPARAAARGTAVPGVRGPVFPQQPGTAVPSRRRLARSVSLGIAVPGVIGVAPRQPSYLAVPSRRRPARAVTPAHPPPGPQPVPVGPPPAIPTSGGDRGYTIRVFREIRPGDVPGMGAQMHRPTGRAFLVPIPTDEEHATHAWETLEPELPAKPQAPPGPGKLELAAGRALDIGRIFADPPYERHRKTCGAIRKIGGTMLTCGRKPGHQGKHSDRGLDWR